MKDVGPYNTAFPADDDTPPPSPPPPHKAPALVGCVVRLEDLTSFSPDPDDLVGLCARLSTGHPHLGRFTPRAVPRVGLALCSPYASTAQIQRCVDLYRDPTTGEFSTPNLLARIDHCMVYVELVVTMTPRYILQLEGPNGEVFLMFIYEPCVDGRHHLLVAGEDAGFLVQNTLVERHLQAGHLLLCNGVLLRPCKQTKFRLPPLPPPEPAENAHLQLSPEDAAAVIAAARLALPLPTVSGVRIVHDTATNRLLAEVSKGSLVAVGW
jgi:hypothetical protein